MKYLLAIFLLFSINAHSQSKSKAYAIQVVNECGPVAWIEGDSVLVIKDSLAAIKILMLSMIQNMKSNKRFDKKKIIELLTEKGPCATTWWMSIGTLEAPWIPDTTNDKTEYHKK